jgi:hypothetical protein
MTNSITILILWRKSFEMCSWHSLSLTIDYIGNWPMTMNNINVIDNAYQLLSLDIISNHWQLTFNNDWQHCSTKKIQILSLVGIKLGDRCCVFHAQSNAVCRLSKFVSSFSNLNWNNADWILTHTANKRDNAKCSPAVDTVSRSFAVHDFC